MSADCSRKLLGVFFNNRSLRILIAGAVFIGHGGGWGCSSEEASSFEGQGGSGEQQADSHGLAAPDVEATGGDFHPFGWKPFDAVPLGDSGVTGDIQGLLDVKVTQSDDVADDDGFGDGEMSDGTAKGDGGGSMADLVISDAMVHLSDADDADVGTPSGVCGNLIVEPGENCEPGLLAGTNVDCCDANCRFASLGVLRGPAISEPLCNPDFCDGQGMCIDKPSLADGTLCTTPTGGDTCCNGQCTQGSPFAGECDSCVLPPIPKLNVFITESQSVNPTVNMDERWFQLLEEVGHSTTFGTVLDLDDVSTLSNVDVLIISSAYTTLSAIAYVNVVGYLKEGGAVYVQSEFKCNLPGNLLFRDLVIEFGGFFKWEYSISGDLVGTKALGCYGKYPEYAPELSYFWHGCSVVDWSADTEPIVWHAPWHNLGFAYCAKSGSQPGLLVTTTDQDWINKATRDTPYAHPLMRNIIARLAFPELCK